MTFPTTASADWITMGLDGQYAFLSSADVVDVKTKKIVAQMKDEYGKPMHSEKFLEMAFSNGKLVRTVSQFGQGRPSAVQSRLSGSGVTATAKVIVGAPIESRRRSGSAALTWTVVAIVAFSHYRG